MGYDRQELACIGERFQPDALIEWATSLVQSARQDLSRLTTRRITEQILRGVEEAISEVRKFAALYRRERPQISPLADVRREAIEMAEDWRVEVEGLASAVFDSTPDVLSRFRPGVRVSRSIPKLATEIGQLLGALREHQASFQGVGGAENLLARGEELRRRLEEAQRRLPEEFERTSGSATDLYHAMGVLYSRARFLGRVARVEFRNDEERLERYSYERLRKGMERHPKPLQTVAGHK